MSDSEDDWENDLADQVQNNKKEDDKKKADFDDEDKVDTEKLKKEQEEKRKKEALEAQKNGRVKTQNKVDLDKLYEERQKKLGGAVDTSKIDTTGMTQTQKGLAMEQAQESKMADQLFGDDDEPKAGVVKAVKLNSEKDYKEFGRSTAAILYKGSAPYRIENFFRELCVDMPEHLESKQMKKILDHLDIKFKEKQKQEKEERDGKNKKKKKADIKGGGGKGYELNNNPNMINDVMGATAIADDDDYGDEYAYDGTQQFKREGEGEYDFM